MHTRNAHHLLNMVTIAKIFLLVFCPVSVAQGSQSAEASLLLDELERRARETPPAISTPPSVQPLVSISAPPGSPETKKAQDNSRQNIAARLALRLSGSLSLETAWRIAGNKGLTKARNQLALSQTGKFSDDLKFKISGRAYYDPACDWTNNCNAATRSDQQSEWELRDTYFDYSNGNWDIRAGKQQVVWGEAVALFYADVVNARDLREFILPSLNMIRIPQWGIDLEHSSGPWHAEFIWMPILEFDKTGVNGAPFAFNLPSEISAVSQDPHKPGNTLTNSETGSRISWRVDGWDLSTFYLHGWTKSPTMSRTIDSSGIYHFSPDYRRLNTWGATFARENNSTIFKGELIYTPGDYYTTFSPNDKDGIIRRDTINYLLSADKKLFSNLATNIQFMQKIIPHHASALAGERTIHNSLAMRIKTSFYDETLEPELTVAASLMETDLLLRPLINWHINSGWQWKLGTDIFVGGASGTFGRFNKQNRIYSTATYSF